MWTDKYHEYGGVSYRVFQDDLGSETIYILEPDASRRSWYGKLIYVHKAEEPVEKRKRKKGAVNTPPQES